MKIFNDADINNGSLFINNTDLVNSPLVLPNKDFTIWTAIQQQTSSGYGAKLTTSRKINFNGKLYRIYCTCYSNVGSCFFVTKGKKIFVH